MRSLKKKNEDGFTLFFVAILLSIAAMIAVTVLQKGRIEEFWNPKVETQARLEKVISVLEAYQRINKRLPCVASRTAAESGSAHGIEQTDCPSVTTAIAGTVRVSVGGQYVRIGAVPYRTLQLNEEMGEDAWGNKLLYAVSEPLTNTALYMTATGNVRVDNAGGMLTSTAAFAILSHGPDSKGAYRNGSGTLVATCASAAGKDQGNCNDAGIFWEDALSSDAGTNHNDDQLLWKKVDYTAQNSD